MLCVILKVGATRGIYLLTDTSCSLFSGSVSEVFRDVEM